jgi:hypothetical protein
VTKPNREYDICATMGFLLINNIIAMISIAHIFKFSVDMKLKPKLYKEVKRGPHKANYKGALWSL